MGTKVEYNFNTMELKVESNVFNQLKKKKTYLKKKKVF